jgi:hypothetical protein
MNYALMMFRYRSGAALPADPLHKHVTAPTLLLLPPLLLLALILPRAVPQCAETVRFEPVACEGIWCELRNCLNSQNKSVFLPGKKFQVFKCWGGYAMIYSASAIDKSMNLS